MGAILMSKKVASTIYITEKQQNQLKELNERLKVPIAAIIRQGIDLIVKKYDEHLSGQIPLPLLEEDEIKNTNEEKT